MSRGDRGEEIYLDDVDRRASLQEIAHRIGLETPSGANATLPSGMQPQGRAGKPAREMKICFEWSPAR
jgi:AraC-like DNA-binding protein